MADTKFTPGPWRVIDRAPMEDGSVYPTHILGCVADFHVCLMESAEVAALLHSGEWKFLAGTSVANARLIAAAPELLEALQAEQEWRDRERDGALDPEWDYELMVGAKRRAAIAKATA